ncbi:hypothetical protein F8388_015464 [Cannabis sativa]|uniref:Uncharacterized protein n=1 Tax=Cannabis sativa TaxID=3483 RepID=A0A7J6GI65_CANSA|nr:hypothetical protein F8388_015464 [Cannabis sativa]
MEKYNSNSSSMTKPINSSPNSEYYSEESGWTAYFQDFSNNNNNNNNIDHKNDDDDEEGSLISYGSSLVSDAASYAAWKISNQRDHHNLQFPAGTNPSIAAGGSRPPPKKLTFKRTRTKVISSDDSLEDTASSPVNSPKVGDLKRAIDMKNKHAGDHFLENNSLGKRSGTLEYYSEMQGSEERSVVDFNEPINECIDLKKRGLCLVPMSMLVNYLG